MRENLAKTIQLNTTRRVQDERELIHALLVDPDHTTAETGLAAEDLIEPVHGHIWAAMIEAEDSYQTRGIGQVVAILKRRGQYDRRAVRQVLASDPRLTLVHWAWQCAELRAQATEARELRRAVETIGKFTSQ